MGPILYKQHRILNQRHHESYPGTKTPTPLISSARLTTKSAIATSCTPTPTDLNTVSPARSPAERTRARCASSTPVSHSRAVAFQSMFPGPLDRRSPNSTTSSPLIPALTSSPASPMAPSPAPSQADRESTTTTPARWISALSTSCMFCV